jgi:hypothetical protein
MYDASEHSYCMQARFCRTLSCGLDESVGPAGQQARLDLLLQVQHDFRAFIISPELTVSFG